MWLSVRIEQLIQTISSILGHIKEGLEKQNSAKPDTKETAYVERGEIAGIITAAIKATNEQVPTRANATEQKDRAQRILENRVQRRMLCAAWTTAIATILAFAAAAYYACIARGQLDKMNDTYREMQDQTLVQIIEAIAAKESADTAASALRENQRQFAGTLNQMKDQTLSTKQMVHLQANQFALANGEPVVTLAYLQVFHDAKKIIGDVVVANTGPQANIEVVAKMAFKKPSTTEQDNMTPTAVTQDAHRTANFRASLNRSHQNGFLYFWGIFRYRDQNGVLQPSNQFCYRTLVSNVWSKLPTSMDDKFPDIHTTDAYKYAGQFEDCDAPR